MKRSVIAANNKRYFETIGYQFVNYADFDFNILKNIMYITRAGKGARLSYSDCIIMADTETSKSDKIEDNHICAWTLSIRAFNINICTLYGHKPSEFIYTLEQLRSVLSGDRILIYFHNLSYDWIFCEKFLFSAFGLPIHQLNTKPFYPIFIQFENGIELRDSYILSQKSLERWANDLDVEHKKAVGCWDYNKIRNQDYIFTAEELTYIEFDTLAGVECLQKTMDNLHKHIYSMPYTATGIVREEVRKRGRLNRAHDRFIKKVMPYDLQMIAQNYVYHGGYTHCNRDTVNWIWDSSDGDNISAFDFASSYPFVMLTEKYPAEKFIKLKDKILNPYFILEHKEDTAFIFKFVAYNIRIKDNVVMPVFQYSKCTKTINVVLDNGRILYADYAEIWLTEIDLMLILQQYNIEKGACFEVYAAVKDYLPRWYTDYVFELFQAKTLLKGGDAVDYSIAKAKLNSL